MRKWIRKVKDGINGFVDTWKYIDRLQLAPWEGYNEPSTLNKIEDVLLDPDLKEFQRIQKIRDIVGIPIPIPIKAKKDD